MVNYTLGLELNYGNVMIFAVQYTYKDIALILYEDRRRKGELFKDFAYLYPQYYASEEEWDDERNLIVANIYTLMKIDEQRKDDLEYLAESMIEFKPAVNHKIQFFNNPIVKKYYSKRDEDRMRFINYMLSLCENKEELSLSKDDFNHLTQLSKSNLKAI